MPTFTEVQTANTAKALTGKVALCVGGSSGCGKGTALVLARQGCSVTIIGRNPERGAEAVAACKSASTAEGATFKFVSLDVRSLTGIKKFCDEFAASNTRLDLLTLSCTRGGIQGYRPTEEGYDERLLSMYLARFAFVHKLLPLLLKAPEPRVLSILSAGHHKPYPKWESDFLTVKASPTVRTYAAGFYNDCAAASLARAHDKLTIVHAFPGIVNTNWHLELPFGLRGAAKLLLRGGAALETAGEYMAYAMLAPAPGFHSLGPHADPIASCAGDAATEDGIWKLSKSEAFDKHLG